MAEYEAIMAAARVLDPIAFIQDDDAPPFVQAERGARRVEAFRKALADLQGASAGKHAVSIDVDDILLRVYCARVDADSGEGASARMIAEDGDGGTKQRRRAECYRPVVMETLVQAGLIARSQRAPVRRKAKDGTDGRP